MLIDIFNHIEPPKYVEAMASLPKTLPGGPSDSPDRNVEHRIRIMDRYGDYDYTQVLTVPRFYDCMYTDNAVELARIANDGVAEIVRKYPEWFVAGVANLPLGDMDASLAEADRAINELKLRGVELWAHREGIPLDSSHYFPLYEKMSEYNLPIWVHPHRDPCADYTREEDSKYGVWLMFGWPFDTTVAMSRLVFSGVMERYPNLKFIFHHCGGMVPFFASRIACLSRAADYPYLKKPPLEYFRMFYVDTALEGGMPALKCAYDFFGADHILFGTDMPCDSRGGIISISGAIQAIEEMDIPDSDKKKIFEDNARRLLRLNV